MTSLYDTKMTSDEQLQRRQPEKTLTIDSDTSDCHDELVEDMQLLGVDARTTTTTTTTTLPDLTTTNDAVQLDDVPIRRRQVRCRHKTLSAMSHSSSSTTTVAVRNRLICTSQTKPASADEPLHIDRLRSLCYCTI